MKLIPILLSMILLNYAKCLPDSCYQLKENPNSFFATKTVYSFVSAKQNYTQPNCKTLQIWLLSRHGTRHPGRNVIDKMYELYDYKNNLTNKSSLCQKDFEAIKAWTFNLTTNDGNILNSQGEIDLQSFGLRLKNVYGDIFNESYNPSTYRVLSSPKSRSVNSASCFLKSAFNMSNVDVPIMKKDDIRLNMKTFKDSYDDDDDDSMKESGNKELQKFIKSIHMQQLIFRVSKTLGLDRNLTLKTVRLMYESCRYEKSWHIDSHPAWCAVFSEEDLKILEYEEDLNYYYAIGYGNSYNERLGCPIVKDLITNFRNKSKTQLGPKGILYFGHSSNVFSAIVRLGFAKDFSPLLSSNFKEMQDRKWKTTNLSPFASNVMAVLYECPDGKKVTIFVNEIPMTVEKLGCTLCPWESIESMFDPIVSSPSCTFNETSSASILSESLILFFLIYLLSLFKAFR